MAKTKEEIINFNNLYTSMHKCKSGVLWKGSVASYYLNGIENTIRLQDQLINGTYQARRPITFTITSPKRREILSVAFRDRVYQRALNDNWIYPHVTKGFIYDNAACQKGKGTDFALKRMKEFLRKAYRKHGQDFYIAKCDIKGYYPNMPHDRVNNIFKARLPEEVFERSLKIMQQQYTGDIGYNPGSQMIQIAGIAALDEIDHYIKEVLRIKWYMRYMDDFILIHQDKAYLEECMQKVKQKLKSI